MKHKTQALIRSLSKVTKRSAIFSLLLALGLTIVLIGGTLMAQRAQAHRPQGESSPQAAVGTGFTYQGYLVRDGTPISDTCDLRFSLWDTDVVGSGSQVGSTQTKAGVPVSEGHFTVPELGFGADAFEGDARYLQIAVRCPAGSGSYVTLDQRATLSAAPYAHSLWPGARVYGAATGTGLGSGVLNVSNSEPGAGHAAILGVSGSALSSYPSEPVGVRGEAAAGIGVAGSSQSSIGVNGYSESGTGVSGYSESGYGVSGSSAGDGTVAGVFGSGFMTATGVYGYSDSGYGIYGSSPGTAIYSDGDAHVEGDLTWQAKTSYIVVPAAAFHPVTDGYSFYNDGYVLSNLDGSSDNYVASVHLPHGATVTALTFYWSDSSSAENGSCDLYRTDVGAVVGGGSIATLLTSGSMGRGSSSVTDVNESIDNSQYMYHLSLYLPDSNVAAHSVVIAYTITEPY
jgi:hypothetical protein